jgi:hypothetical protein
MIKSSIEKLSETIGFEVGMSDDVTQANLLNGFCKALANSMDENKRSNQLCYIADKLDSKSHKVLKELVEFIKLKEKN